MHRSPLSFALLTAALASQGPTTGFGPNPSVSTMVAEGIPELLAQAKVSAIGKLLADEEVAAAWDLGLRRYRRMMAQRDEAIAAALAMELQLEPWLVQQIMARVPEAALRDVDLADMQRAEFGGVLIEGADLRHGSPVATFATFTCLPRAEGRWTALFERQARILAGTRFFQAIADLKFAGFPVYGFRKAPNADASDEQQPEFYGDLGVWLLHLPGQFAFGTATPEACGTLGPLPTKAPAQVLLEMNMEAYARLFAQFGNTPPEFEALGFTALKHLRWRGRFVGHDVCDEIEVELAAEPKGMVGALLAGKAALPPQPLPEGALAQLRAAIDLPMLLSTADAMRLGDELPEELRTRVAKALTGGIAIGACAPAPGAIVPRIFLSVGIADAKAVDDLLALIFSGGATKKEVTYEGVTCTVVTIRDMPAAVQPTYCTVDGVLHLTESATSMRAFLKARAKGGDAMEVGDVPIPAGDGDVLPTFDVRCDERAMYQAFHKVWLPFVKLVPSEISGSVLLQPDEMPSPDAVLPLLGKSRGVLRRDGKVYRLQQQGPLGGLLTAALAMTWGPLASSIYSRDFAITQLANQVAHKRLEDLWTALDAFRHQNKRLPNDLAELVVTMKLPADALLVPGDDEAEAVPMPAGDARAVKSSFRYFKDGVKVDVQGSAQTMLLIAIAPRPYGRPMLGDDGSMPDVYGESSQRAIDQFGK
ncbi:MAG: hypothetical protein U1E73_05830 [Planctomycetota bacterium]